MSHLKQFEHLKLPLEAIKAATNNFSNESLIGKGGFGEVYRGEIVLSQGKTVAALKRLDRKFGQGDPEFWKEIMTLSWYKHTNIVSLLGYCDDCGEKILVYEYAPKKSLEQHLNSSELTWALRLHICIGAARGLAYLHNSTGAKQQRVLHRDIKSQNILLDEYWNAKISDFGLSKFGPANQENTFLYSATVGTHGYVDPLYHETCLLTKESDVYSFGVVLFEVLCGRLCFGNKDDRKQPLIGLVRESYEQNTIKEIICGNIKDKINRNSLQVFTTIAYQCLKIVREDRPKMSVVVTELETALRCQETKLSTFSFSSSGPLSPLSSSIQGQRPTQDQIPLGSFFQERRQGGCETSPNRRNYNGFSIVQSKIFQGLYSMTSSNESKKPYRGSAPAFFYRTRCILKKLNFFTKFYTTEVSNMHIICRQFKFRELDSATRNFNESLIIGRGGFGKVYKGVVIIGSSKMVAAIKRWDSTSEHGAEEFRTELEMLPKLRHCNIIPLIGYCNYREEMILVYEYMPNGSLHDHLHKLGTPVSWIQRLKICIGAAHGLHYLHNFTGIEVGVIHRDVKSSNILLHESWAPIITDFGLAMIGPTYDQSLNYVDTLVMGTHGYLDPDYYNTGKVTMKSDVYAFGVVLFEVLCRRLPIDRSFDRDQSNLATLAEEVIKKGELKYICDSDISDQIAPKCLKEFGQIAVRCVHRDPEQRPTMAEVSFTLESILIMQKNYNDSLHFGHQL